MKLMMLAGGAMLLSISAQAEPFGVVPPRQPFVATLSNNTPLAFGMDAEQVRDGGGVGSGLVSHDVLERIL